jgi:hypothetical protein
MGKSAQKRKRQQQQQPSAAVSRPTAVHSAAKKSKTTHLPSPTSRSPSPSEPLISPEDIETTLLTLETLAEIPEELARKEAKDVKRAVFALHKVMAEGMTLGTLHLTRHPSTH